MSTIQKAIEEITYTTKRFPKEPFAVIQAHAEEAIPYLRKAIEKAIVEKGDLEKEYQLHFYALFLLAEFRDTKAFELIVELASLPEEVLDCLIGDTVTEGLANILYSTYNGNLELLKKSIWNPKIDDFARSAMLKVIGQLYLDGDLGKDELQEFLNEIIYSEEEIGEYIYTELITIICHCHFVEMLPQIRLLFQQERIDETVHGAYDSCVDWMFSYREEGLCSKIDTAADCLKGWAMFEKDFEDTEKSKKDRKEFEKLLREMTRQTTQEKVVKIGRNDPCPCGSGKKYKKCCMNKPKGELDVIEDLQERQKWLKYYPPGKAEDKPERVYLEDYYDEESIEIDKSVYLALMHRAIPIWIPIDEKEERKRKTAYLWNAFEKMEEKMNREKIADCSAYDAKYAIHYACREWLPVLEELLRDAGEREKRKRVLTYIKMIGK